MASCSTNERTLQPGFGHVRRESFTVPAAFATANSSGLTPERMSNRQVKGVGTFDVLEADVAEWGARIRRKYLGSTPWPVAGESDGRVVLRLAPERLTAHGGDFTLSRAQGTP